MHDTSNILVRSLLDWQTSVANNFFLLRYISCRSVVKRLLKDYLKRSDLPEKQNLFDLTVSELE